MEKSQKEILTKGGNEMEKELPWYSTKFNKPIKGGKLTQYAKLIIFAYQHKDQEFSRFDLLKQSGVLSDLNIKGFEIGEVTRTYTMEGWEPNSYTTTHTGNTPTSRCRGFDICLTAGLRALGLLEYNTKTKKWKAGPNLEKYLQLKGLIK